MSGEQTWTNVNFSYSVDGFAPDGDGSWLDMTMCWGGEGFAGVSAHYFLEPWSLPPSEPLNQVFFYPNGTYTLPTNTLLWSVSPVNMTVENVIPIPPNYDTVQVYHDGMRLNGEWLSMNYSVTVARTDFGEVVNLPVAVGIKRTNVQNQSDYRVMDTVDSVMCSGEVLTFNLTWRETSSMKPGIWKISGFVDLLDHKIYWDTNTTDNEVVNDTVEAKELVGDISGNGIVDVFDAIKLSNAFTTTPSSPRWNPDCDLNFDGQIDIYDAIIFSNHFGGSIGGGSGQGSQMGDSGMGGKTMLDGAGIAVDASQLTVFKDETFNVNVKITGVIDLLGWEFKLFWNNTVLNCTSSVVQTPTEWQSNAQNYGSGLENGYNATNARFWAAQSVNYPASSFNGSMTIATLSFKAMQPGTTSLTLMETKLGNSTADPIDHTESSGSVTVYFGRYMRDDMQTINNLSAYLLNATETSALQAEYEQTSGGYHSYWGIRAWMRCPNGTEVEIQLSNQTGTPKAVIDDYYSTTTELSAATVVTSKTWVANASLVVRVYFSWDNSTWKNIVTFTTEKLAVTLLKSATWTVYYDVYHYYNFRVDKSFGYFYWGTTTYNSRIQNLQFN
jgi:hypothetical protein